jgi:aminoglycoside 3-N-acetyltransferase I
MQQNFEIRLLQAAGTSQLRQLNSVFAQAFSDPETYLNDPPSDEHLAAWLADQNNIALVALDSGIVVGGLVAYVLLKCERARREIYIYDLAVAEGHRRMGIATALIRRLQDIAHKVGAWVIYVQADYGDDHAIALYQKFAARAEVLHFDIPVQGEA